MKRATEPAQFTRGYGLVFGRVERKAMSMALADRAMRAAELGEAADNPANDIEFMLYHSDNVEASGFVQHLKLPHYVDFQANLELLRRLRAEQDPNTTPTSAPTPQPQPSQQLRRPKNRNLASTIPILPLRQPRNCCAVVRV